MAEILWRRHLDTVYDISNVGTVRHRRKGTFNKLSKNAGGYLVWNCYRQGLEIITYVHHAVALAFLPNPEGHPTIDHKNRDKTDNRVENLRWASYSLQCSNRDCYSASGFKGVYKRGKKYDAYITINKKKVNLGSYSTAEQASAAHLARYALEGFVV